MAIRLPLQGIGQFTESNELGAGSIAGGIAHPFILPLDTDNIVVKFTASVVARSSIVSNGAVPQWLSATTQSNGIRTASVVATGSVVAGAGIGSSAASTISQGQVSGLPLLGAQNRVFVVITGNVTSAASNSIVTTVSANNVSASHN